VVIQQHSRKLVMMDILMSETCWAHNKWNKIASVIKLVFHSSTVSVKSEHDAVEARNLQAFIFRLEALLSSLNTITVPLLYSVSQKSLDTTGNVLTRLVAWDFSHTLYKCNVIIILSELLYTCWNSAASERQGT